MRGGKVWNSYQGSGREACQPDICQGAEGVLDDGDGREWKRIGPSISMGRCKRGEVLWAMLGLLKNV